MGKDELQCVLSAISQHMDLGQVLDVDPNVYVVNSAASDGSGARSSKASDVPCKLLGMVCFYGKHYKAFFLQKKEADNNGSNSANTSHQAWYALDDSKATEIGNWASVVKFCNEGKWRPTLIMYQCSAPALAPPKSASSKAKLGLGLNPNAASFTFFPK